MGRQDRERRAKPKLCRWSNEREGDAREVYDRSKRFANVGVTHIAHILGSDGLPMDWSAFRRSCRPSTAPCDRPEYNALLDSLPEAWRATLLTNTCRRLPA